MNKPGPYLRKGTVERVAGGKELAGGDFLTRQGEAAEAWVAKHLGDEARVRRVLDVWRTARLSTDSEYRSGKAANNPDYLIFEDTEDGKERIKAVVEVKAVKGDHDVVERRRIAIMNAWAQDLVLCDLGRWKARVETFVQSKKDEIVRQVMAHAKRMQELEAAEVINVAPDVEMVIYVPEDQDFGEWPRQIDVGERSYPLRIEFLPPLAQIKDSVSDEFVDTAMRRERHVPKRPDEVIEERLRAMRELRQRLYALGLEDDVAVDRFIRLLIVGGGMSSEREGEVETIGADDSDVDELLFQMSTTAPSVSGAILYEAVGGKLKMKETDRRVVKFWEEISNVLADLDGKPPIEVVAAVLKAREKLTRKGWRISKPEKAKEGGKES